MSRAVKNDRGDIADLLTLGLGDGLEVGLDGSVEVHDVGGFGADGDLVHVDARTRVEHGASLGDGNHRDGVVLASGGQRGAVDRVHGDVDGGPTRTDLLTVEQHRGFVLLALADDDDALHGDGVENQAHGVDGRAVGTVLVSPTKPAAGCQRRSFGSTGQVHGQVAVGQLGGDFHQKILLVGLPSH